MQVDNLPLSLVLLATTALVLAALHAGVRVGQRRTARGGLHLERLTVAIRNRVPMPTWLTLYAVLIIGMLMMGAQIGQSGTRHFVLELALAVSFSLVLLMIADLDRPQQGLVRVSQQAMTDLQTRLGRR